MSSLKRDSSHVAIADSVQCRPWDGRDAPPVKRSKLGEMQSLEAREISGKFSNPGFLDLGPLSGL